MRIVIAIILLVIMLKIAYQHGRRDGMAEMHYRYHAWSQEMAQWMADTIEASRRQMLEEDGEEGDSGSVSES